MKIAFITFICIVLIVFQSQWLSGHQGPPQQQPPQKHEEHHLKVLPKNISDEELIGLMKVWSRSLGVKCGACHVSQPGTPPKFDFASDAKPEKQIAREMVKMSTAINEKYIQKIGKKNNMQLENITCVSCHMGHLKPIVSVDSLMMTDRRGAAPAPAHNGAPADTTKK
jgi:hypothetical protein